MSETRGLAEQRVLGAMLLDSPKAQQAFEHLSPQSFTTKKNSIIFSTAAKLFADKSPIDIVTVAEKMAREGTLYECGGLEYITFLIAQVPSACEISGYIEELNEVNQ